MDIICRHTNGTDNGQIASCKGPQEILKKFERIGPGETFPELGGWKILKVRRGGEELGTLFDVRQAFSYYQMLLDGWAESKGLKWRRMRK